MKIKEQTRQVATYSTWVRQGEVDMVWRDFRRVSTIENKLKNGNIQQEQKTLPTLIRNIIHHPENQNNSYTTEELEESTELLLNILHDLV